MIAALVVIICCSESWVESLPWSVWPFGVGQMRQNYAPVVWPDEMAIYHPVYRRQSAFLPQQSRHRPLSKSDGLSRGSTWINPSSVEVDSLFSFRGDREVALKPASGGILFAGDDDDSVIRGTHKQVHHRRPTPPPATTSTTTPCPLTTSTSNYEPVQVTRHRPIFHRHFFIDNDLNLKNREWTSLLYKRNRFLTFPSANLHLSFARTWTIIHRELNCLILMRSRHLAITHTSSFLGRPSLRSFNRI